MQERLSSLEQRAFLRLCHQMLLDQVSLDAWTALQKSFLMNQQASFGLYIRQLKKLDLDLKNDIVDGFSNGQVESKLWLIEVLGHILPQDLTDMNICILGSWFGLLAKMLSWSNAHKIKSIRCIDIDPRWEKLGPVLSEPESYDKIQFITADMTKITYKQVPDNNIIINTSCEHLADFESWYQLIPNGSFIVLQANDFIEHHEHTFTWSNADLFAKSSPLTVELYHGTLQFPQYQRFMRIGVK